MSKHTNHIDPPSSFEELKLLIHSELQQIEQGKQVDTWAIYTRLSREETHGYSYSLEIQPDRAEAYAREKGAAQIKLYSDPYKTGRNSRRKELQRLVADIKAKRVNTVVVHRLDRLYRNLESQLEFVRLCKKYQVQFISVTEQIDPETWWGRLVLYVLGAMAEMYVRQTSERTREAKSERIRRGLPNGNVPLGYCNELARAKLPPTPVEPEQIKTAVDAVATLRRYKPDAGGLLALLGAVLERAPLVTLDELAWSAGADPQSDVLPAEHRRDEHEQVLASDGKYYQVAEISAHLEPFDGDFRKAIALVDGLAEELKATPRVHSVEVLQYPLDVRPESSVSGSATAAGARVVPTFKIKLVLGVGDGQAG